MTCHKKTSKLQLRLTETLKSKVVEYSEKDGISQNSILNQAVAWYVKRKREKVLTKTAKPPTTCDSQGFYFVRVLGETDMNNVSNINETSNSVKSMPLIAHSGAPVITTDMLADVYGTEVINIQVNHSRNKNRFIEGKHFYKLTGSILKEFKNWLTKSKLVYKGSEIISKHAKSIILWTERGAARHAKMLDTDNAWDVFEALEDFYFAKREDAQQKISLRQSTAKELTPLRQTAERLIATGVGNIYPDIWKYVHKEFGVEHINELLPEQIPQAISFLDALEGEYLPKQIPLPESSFNKQLSIKTLEGAMTHIRTMREYWNSGLQESLKQLGYPHTGSLTEHMIEPLFKIEWVIREIKGNDITKLPA